MTHSTLLALVQTACLELGVPSPSSVVGNSDMQVRQLLALANREGWESHRAAGENGGWQAMRVEWTFNLVPAQSAYSLPADFDFFIPQTAWDRSYRWQLLGPLSAQEWQVLQSGISPVGPRMRFRIFGNAVNFQPTPGTSTTDLICFEYMSNGWCQSAASVRQSAWAADTDTFVLDDQLMILGLKWRFKQAKGLPYEDIKEDYRRLLDQLLARDAGSRTLPLNASAGDIRLLNQANVPDTGYGS